MATAFAVGTRLLLDPLLGSGLPFLTFFPALAFVAWYAGMGPALLVVILSCAALPFFILEPRMSFSIAQRAEVFGLAFFALLSLLIVSLFEQLRRSALKADRDAAYLRVTLASIGDAVITTDDAGNVTFMNDVAQRLTGWGLSEARGSPLKEIFQIFNETSRLPVESPVDKVLRAGQIVGLANHTILIARDGRERPIDDSAAPIRDSNGAMIGVVLVFRDFSEQRQAQKKLRESEELTRAILETALDCVITMDTAGRVVQFNTAAERIFGYKRAEVIGHELAELIIPPSLREQHRRGLARFLDSGSAPVLGKRIEISAMRADRSEFMAELAIAQHQGSPPVLFTGFLRDISARTAEQRLRTTRLAVTQALHYANGIKDGACGVMQAICENLDWDTALFWTVDEERERLTVCESWQNPASMTHIFTDVSKSRHFVKGEGLPGLVWESGQDLWINDLELAHDFPRKDSARLQGLRSGFSHPVAVQGRVVGVFEFFSTELREANPSLTELMNTVTGIFAQFHDRQSVQHQLLQSEERFRLLADAMPQIMWSARANGIVDYRNRKWYEFTGRREAAGNEGWSDILHPDDAPYARTQWADSLKHGTSFDMEIRLFDRANECYRWHLLRTVPAKDSAGHVTQWFGTATDIDRQKRAEESSRYLAEASAALATLEDLDSTLQKVAGLAVPYFSDWAAVDMHSSDGTLRRVAVSHRDPDKMAFVSRLQDEYPPDPQSETGAYAVLRSGKAQLVSDIGDEMLVAAAKDERHLKLIRSLGLKSFLCVPLIVVGKTIGTLTFATAESGRRYDNNDLLLALDLANRASIAIENAQLYVALREADRRKDEFLATLAHELRNPLSPISSALHILKGLDSASGIHTGALKIMERQVTMLVRLVDDLLDVSRVTAGKIEIHKKRIELGAVIETAVEMVRPLIDQQRHRLIVQVDAALPVCADPIRLAQVIGNILTNAAKYSEPNKRIWLSAEQEGNNAVLRIRDEGIGIAAPMLSRIFELFVQADHATTKSHGGLGIGLTLAKNLVAMHGGTIEACSEGLGKGSEFIVRIPISTEVLSLSSDIVTEGAKGATGLRLLVVDDNEDAANTLDILLRRQGHEVRIAHSGASALEIAPSHRPDIVFLDIGMPEMDGFEVARRLRQHPEVGHVILVALTGWGQEEDRRKSKEAGFDHHIVKPPEFDALLSVIERTRVQLNSEHGQKRRPSES